MTLTDLHKTFNLFEIPTIITCMLVLNMKTRDVNVLINGRHILKVYLNLNQIKTLIWNADCIETNYVYYRSSEKNERWQTKQALDYVAEGGENTYASYSDDDILENFDTIYIHDIRFE